MRDLIVPRLGERKIDRLRPAELDHFYASLQKRLSATSVLKVQLVVDAKIARFS
jgi:hypothetical protein